MSRRLKQQRENLKKKAGVVLKSLPISVYEVYIVNSKNELVKLPSMFTKAANAHRHYEEIQSQFDEVFEHRLKNPKPFP